MNNKRLKHYVHQVGQLISRGSLESIDQQSPSWNTAISNFLLERISRERQFYERHRDPRITYSSLISQEERLQRIKWDTAVAGKHGVSANHCLQLTAFFNPKQRLLQGAIFPDPRFQNELTLVKSREAIESQLPQDTIRLLKDLKGKNSLQQRQIDLLNAEALLFSGQTKEARRAFDTLHNSSFLDERVCQQLFVLCRDAGELALAKGHSQHRKAPRGQSLQKANQFLFQYHRLQKTSAGPKDLTDCLDSAIQAYPLYWPAHMKQALFVLAGLKPIEGFDHALTVLEFAPQFHSELLGFFQVAWGSQGFYKYRERYRLETLIQKCPQSPRGHLIRAILQSYAVEKLGRNDLIDPTIALLNALLKNDPSAPTPRLCRAFLFIRKRQFERAEDDLRIFEEDQTQSSLLHFYKGLLIAAQARPATELAEELQKVSVYDFALWKRPGWTVTIYPELKSYRELKEIQAVIGSK